MKKYILSLIIMCLSVVSFAVTKHDTISVDANKSIKFFVDTTTVNNKQRINYRVVYDKKLYNSNRTTYEYYKSAKKYFCDVNDLIIIDNKRIVRR